MLHRVGVTLATAPSFSTLSPRAAQAIPLRSLPRWQRAAFSCTSSAPLHLPACRDMPQEPISIAPLRRLVGAPRSYSHTLGASSDREKIRKTAGGVSDLAWSAASAPPIHLLRTHSSHVRDIYGLSAQHGTLWGPHVPQSLALHHIHARAFSSGPPSKPPPTGFLAKTMDMIRGIPAKVRHEIKHYWTGSKLLYYEVKIAFGLLLRVIGGAKLTRRERKQLTRTAADLIRIVPLLIFVVIPFMEFLLPFVIKLFPNILPSTFQDQKSIEENRKNRLKIKLEVANILQDAVHQRAKKSLGKSSDDDTAEEFGKFLDRIQSGSAVNNRDITKFSQLFDDQFTVDKLTRDQLVAMAKFLNQTAYGTNTFLRYVIERKLREIRQDDKMIEAEGVENLSLSELQSACRDRGLKGVSRSPEFLREHLRNWLDLSLNQKIPIGLLILANSFKITETMNVKDALRETLYHMPESVVDEIRLQLKSDAEKKLALLKEESDAIQAEAQEAEDTEKAIRDRQLKHWVLEEGDIAQRSITFSAAQLKEVVDAVDALAQKSTFEDEHSRIQNLKQLLEQRRLELAEAERARDERDRLRKEEAEREKEAAEIERARTLKDATPAEIAEYEQEKKERQREADEAEKKAQGEREAELERIKKEKANIDAAEGQIEKLVESIESEFSKLEVLSDAEKLLDKDQDGIVSIEELSSAVQESYPQLPEEAVQEVIRVIDSDRDGLITMAELKQRVEKRLVEMEEEEKM
eukprot:TRINITY_DN4789_c0_g1_i2.p1 TRINITY_DN4789_c0_g1~~TRINITY_DN4789_c0_g1_i2.p1  ORF type:complete len:748 (-),score=254.35 TRINITY_DN4789_c0_g1_i2:21-2264(-)